PALSLFRIRACTNSSRAEFYRGNYALLHVKDQIARVNDVGSTSLFGYEYSMRVWLDPNKLASLGLTGADVVQAIQEQNKQVAAGIVGQPAPPPGTEVQYGVNAPRPVDDHPAVGGVVVRPGAGVRSVKLRQ